MQPNAAATGAIRDRLRDMTGLDDRAATSEVVRATYDLLAEAPSALVTATLDDALAVEERPNMPATSWQRPNWCIPLPEPLESAMEKPLVRSVAASLSRRVKRSKRTAAKASGKPTHGKSTGNAGRGVGPSGNGARS